MNRSKKRMPGNKIIAVILAMLMVLGGNPILLVSGGGKAYAATVQKWKEVGTPYFSAGGIQYPSLVVAADGTPYLAYSDGGSGNGGKATVMKYDRGSDAWVSVGAPAFSASYAQYTSLYVTPDGTLYVAYAAYGDTGNFSKATVKRYDNSSNTWKFVGDANGFSSNNAKYTSLYVAADGTPYVAYQDADVGNKATVMKYDSDNDTWSNVGNAGFSAGTAEDVSLVVAADGTPYVAYQDAAKGKKVTVMKYDSDSDEWTSVGSAGLSDGEAQYTSLRVAADGTLYVAYKDNENNYRATVMKYDSVSDEWASVGSEGFSSDEVLDLSLYIANGIPYVAYRDYGNDLKATVMKFDSDRNTWALVGNAGFSEGRSLFTTLYVTTDGTPYVAYLDFDNYKAVVMNYSELTEAPVLTADDSDNDTDHAIEITSTGDSDWESKITTVKDGTTTLTAGEDYSIDDGTITIHAGVLARGIHTIKVSATGFVAAIVDQEIGESSEDFDGGIGTFLDPYQIATAEQLDAVRNYPDSHFILTDDIDLSDYASGDGWQPIGDSDTPFQGSMDGDGYVITGLTINRPEEEDEDEAVGLFGHTDHAELSNMAIEDAGVTGDSDSGILVGSGIYGTISNSYVEGSVSGNGFVGGLVGYGDHVTISASSAAVTVNGSEDAPFVGGLVGSSVGETISNSYATGTVSGDQFVGGLVGYSDSDTISNSYAMGTVSGNSFVGGLVGGNDHGTISNSYANGYVDGTNELGGLVGYSWGGTVNNSFYDMDATGQDDEGKGDGKSTDEMKTQSTYGDAGWDFASTWGIHSARNDGYPFLHATLTIEDEAELITSVTAPIADATSLTLPTVPSGYTIAIKSSSNTAVIGINGTITPPATATSVNLVFTITRTSNSATADTGSIAVTVPAHALTAAEIAADITTVTAPVADATSLTLPTVPSGY
ncbi:hemoblobin-interacting domain-containing protein, partial [Cohnella soli]